MKQENAQDIILMGLISALLFIIALPYCFFGLDVTDTGFHLYEQQVAVLQKLAYFKHNPLYPLSNIIGGFYQWLCKDCGLLYARVGGVITYILTAILTYKLFAIYAHSKSSKITLAKIIVLYSFIAVSPFSFAGALILIDYYTVPMLLFVATSYCLSRCIKNSSYGWLLLGNLFLLGLIFSRITMITYLVFSLSTIFLFLNSRDQENKNLLATQCSCMVFIILGYVLYYQNLVVSNLLSSAFTVYDLLLIYFQHLQTVLDVVVVLFCLILLGYFLTRYKSKRHIFKITFLFMLSLLLFSMILLIFKLNSEGYLYNLATRLDLHFSVIIVLVLSGLLAALTLFSLKRKKIEPSFYLLILMGLGFPFMINFGTDTGLYKMGYGIWFLPPTLLLLLEKKFPYYSRIFYKASVIIGMLSILKLYTGFYRDNDNIFELNHSIDLPKLTNVYTTLARGKSYEDLITNASRYINEGDMVFAFDFNPMFYWVTNTKAPADISWPHLNGINFLKEKLGGICIDPSLLPKIIIISEAATFDKDWPKTKSSFDLITRDKEEREFINGLIRNQCKSELIWSNGYFSIYKPALVILN